MPWMIPRRSRSCGRASQPRGFARKAGRSHGAVSKGTRWARAAFAQGDACVWFDRARLSPMGAAFINSSAASVLDLDDGHRVASGHPGAAVIPAVIAVGESIG